MQTARLLHICKAGWQPALQLFRQPFLLAKYANQYRQNTKCYHNPIHIILAPFGKTAGFRFFVTAIHIPLAFVFFIL
jgi:hypothetical protein